MKLDKSLSQGRKGLRMTTRHSANDQDNGRISSKCSNYVNHAEMDFANAADDSTKDITIINV